MIRIYIDTNVFLNVWNREIDPKTKTELWKGSAQVLQLIEEEKIKGITSLTTLMEIVHVFRRRKQNYNEAIKDLEDLGIEIFIPNSFTLLKAFEFQQDYEPDPYDSIALAVAIESNCDYLITRDEAFAKKANSLIKICTPEMFLEEFQTTNKQNF